jgi:hypothetical protein
MTIAEIQSINDSAFRAGYTNTRSMVQNPYNPNIEQLQYLIWKYGYDNGKTICNLLEYYQKR